MDNNLVKSLTDLIDETLAEIEALKKSDRFSAEEIELAHDSNGSTDTESVNKADEEEEDEGEEHEDEDEEKEDEAKKAEHAYKKAEEECEKAEKSWKDAMAKRDMCKAEHDKYCAKEEEAHKAEGVNQLAKEEEDKKEKKMKKMEKKLAKSLEERVAPLESQIAQVLEAVKQLAESPVPARGATYKTVQPLAKGATEAEPLNKSQVLDELLTLKKSGKEVFIEDVLKAEIGGNAELQEIANKYGIK